MAERGKSPKLFPPKKETDRAVKGGCRTLQITLTAEEYALLEKARELRSHCQPGASNSQLLIHALAEYVERHDPVEKAKRAFKRNERKRSARPVEKSKRDQRELMESEEYQKVNQNESVNSARAEMVLVGNSPELEFHQGLERGNLSVRSLQGSGGKTNRSSGSESRPVQSFRGMGRRIPSAEAHGAWKNYDGQGCRWVDPGTGKRCGSKHRLQLDHVFPFSKGGRHETENLQILCAQHNNYKGQMPLRI